VIPLYSTCIPVARYISIVYFVELVSVSPEEIYKMELHLEREVCTGAIYLDFDDANKNKLFSCTPVLWDQLLRHNGCEKRYSKNLLRERKYPYLSDWTQNF